MTARPTRTILFASHSAALAGAERGLFELAQGLAIRGHNISILLPQKGPLAELFREAGMRVHFSCYRSWAGRKKNVIRRIRRIFGHLRAAYRLTSEVSHIAPDVIITNTVTVPSAAITARQLHVPHIWYIREFGEADHGLSFDLGFRASVYLIDYLSDSIIVNCRALRDFFSRWISPSRINVIYNAVELGISQDQLERWRSKRSSSDTWDLRCVLVGRIASSKGQEDAIRAVSILARSGIAAQLTLVGTGHDVELERLQTLASTLEVAEQVEFVGFSERPLRYFCQADVALVCSRFEAFGRVTVEALKCGCPVVGTNRGGIVEHVQDGKNGFTYTPGDAATLAAQLRRIVSDASLRAELAENAAQGAKQRYHIAQQVREVEAVLTDVLGARR